MSLMFEVNGSNVSEPFARHIMNAVLSGTGFELAGCHIATGLRVIYG